MRWFRRRGKDADESPSGMTDFTAGPDAFTAPMAEGFKESFVPGVCDICGTSTEVFSCRFCEHEGVKRPVRICGACFGGPVWEAGTSHAATQHPLRRYVFHAISVMFSAHDFVRAEVQKSLLAECATVTDNDEDARAIVAMAEPRVEYHIEAASDAASQAIHQARTAAHRAVAAFREGRAGVPSEDASQHLASPTAIYTDVSNALAALTASRTDHEGKGTHQTAADHHAGPPRNPVAASCGICGSNGDNGWVAICGLCKGEGAIPPLQVCNVCWGTRAIIEPHVVTNHPNNRYIFHAVTVQHLLGYWLRDAVQSSLRMECTMFTQDEDAKRCIAVATPSVAGHIGAAADAAAKAITEARTAAHEAIAAFRKTRTGS